MNSTIYIIIGIAFASFVFVLAITMVEGKMLMRSADKRLAAANEMVLKLASSADKLAETMVTMKELMAEREKEHEKEINTLTRNYEDMCANHSRLVERYTRLEDKLHENYDIYTKEILRSVTEMAKKTTITNNPILHEK